MVSSLLRETQAEWIMLSAEPKTQELIEWREKVVLRKSLFPRSSVPALVTYKHTPVRYFPQCSAD